MEIFNLYDKKEYISEYAKCCVKEWGNTKTNLEFFNQKLDMKFMKYNMRCTIYPSIHVFEFKMKTEDSESFYKNENHKINRMLKTLHKE